MRCAPSLRAVVQASRGSTSSSASAEEFFVTSPGQVTASCNEGGLVFIAQVARLLAELTA